MEPPTQAKGGLEWATDPEIPTYLKPRNQFDFAQEAMAHGMHLFRSLSIDSLVNISVFILL